MNLCLPVVIPILCTALYCTALQSSSSRLHCTALHCTVHSTVVMPGRGRENIPVFPAADGTQHYIRVQDQQPGSIQEKTTGGQTSVQLTLGGVRREPQEMRGGTCQVAPGKKEAAIVISYRCPRAAN